MKCGPFFIVLELVGRGRHFIASDSKLFVSVPATGEAARTENRVIRWSVNRHFECAKQQPRCDSRPIAHRSSNTRGRYRRKKKLPFLSKQAVAGLLSEKVKRPELTRRISSV